MDPVERAQLETFGYLVIRRCFEAGPLVAEVDRALLDAFPDGHRHLNTGSAGNQFRYVPMMAARTPVSLRMVTRLAGLAADLLGAEVLPGRSKATEYRGSTAWHRDSDGPVRSIGVLCYLDAVDERSGALQVVPGSHHRDFGAAIGSHLDDDRPVPGVHLATAPGDAIVFDERLYHASSGGGTRRQWRVDFVADSGRHDSDLNRYYAGQHTIGWDGGYDVDRFPSYGPAWRSLDDRWTSRLEALGVFELVSAEERHVRDERRRRSAAQR
jgi:hypothetical protein